VGDGIGRNLVINANLIMGNAAEAGSGGGIRFQGVNGVEVSTFPTNPSRWYSVNVTNNIIANNVAGWDGGGVSLQDSIGVNLINNTIISNDSTASSGSLFGAFFAPQASAPTPCPRDAQGANIPCVPLSDPQPAGLSSAGHTAEFLASLPANITCPAGHTGVANNNTLVNGACRTVSFPILYNDVFWQNRAFNIAVTTPAAGAQQATVTLVPALNQTSTGACVPPPNALSYWDIGLRGDHGPSDHSSGVTFTPRASILTNASAYPGSSSGLRANSGSNPSVVKQYCNGSKIPPEAGASVWYLVPPGTNEGNVPVPIFNLTAGATVDEGNNWISMTWGPLALTSPATGAILGDYSLAAGSPAIGYITPGNSSTTYSVAPADDYFGTQRKTNNAVDAGAVEFAGGTGGGGTGTVSISPNPLTITLPTASISGTGVVTLTNTQPLGGASVTVTNVTVTAPGSNPLTWTLVIDPLGSNANTCTGTTLAPTQSCTVRVRFSSLLATRGVNRLGTITFTDNATGSPQSGALIGHAN
jgi:hypothetical protein